MLRPDAPPRRADGRKGWPSPHWIGIGISLFVHGAAIAGILGARGLTMPPRPLAAIPVELVAVTDDAPAAPRQGDGDAESRRAELPSDDLGHRGIAEAATGQRAEPAPPAAPVEPAAAAEAKPVKSTAARAPAPAPEPPPAVAKAAPVALSLEAARPPPPLPRAKPPLPARPAAPMVAQPAPRERVPEQAMLPTPSAAAALLPEERSPESPAMAARRAPVPTPSRHEIAALSPAAPGDGEGKGSDDAAGSAPRYQGAGVSNPPPRYPYLARRRGQEGRVTLRVRVTAAGEAAAVSVRRSSGYPLLDAAAVEAVRAWRFVPARRDGTRVAGAVDVPISFELTER